MANNTKKVFYHTRWVPSDEAGCRMAFFGNKLILQRKLYEERQPYWPFDMRNDPWERTGNYRFVDATVNDAIEMRINTNHG